MSDAIESTIQTLQEQFTRLKWENVRLSKENAHLLREKYRLLTASGSQTPPVGERIEKQAKEDVARWIDGFKPAPGKGYNLVQRQSKQTFQVQFNVQKGRRWQWKRLGRDESDKYDRLILIGVFEMSSKSEHRQYNLPYILFDVPGEDVPELASREQQDICVDVSQLTMTDNMQKEVLFDKYQVSPDELSRRYNTITNK